MQCKTQRVNAVQRLHLFQTPILIHSAAEFLLLFIIFGLIGRWVYRDAKSRGSDWAWQWGVGIALLFLAGLVPGLLGILIYVSVRGERTESMS